MRLSRLSSCSLGLALALLGCGTQADRIPEPATPAAVTISVPATTLAYGSSVQVTATALDARGRVLEGITGFTFASSDRDVVEVSESGVATAVFGVRSARSATLTATLAHGGSMLQGSVDVTTGPPSVFDHAALMLSEYEHPRVPTSGQGAAFLSVSSSAIEYAVSWSVLSSPAVGVSIRGPGDATQVADVLVELPVPAQSARFGSITGIITEADILPPGSSLETLLAWMATGNVYVEVRSVAFPAGEIRGQLVAVAR